ncbi:hypothetical protein WS61_07375 [Burkholderia sp. ABCPW 11]|uniref:hypothetical protein n=1 Tax=Burkholderia sp. ABCPW 11 TaxID=1637859 RepID=UPI00075F5252|nr:hypothetical protein [Burkholderia sp. ABCPW 11]KVD48632.1 hypothetical protein WS61_07375 [Burkholderia sp. ABCPW 11]
MSDGVLIPTPTVTELADAAVRSIEAGRAAATILAQIDADTAAPDALAAQLLVLLAAEEPQHHGDILTGFLRPVQKRLEEPAARLRDLAYLRSPFAV